MATLKQIFWLNIIGVFLWQLSIYPCMYDGSFPFYLDKSPKKIPKAKTKSTK
jgi:hypothetical protein